MLQKKIISWYLKNRRDLPWRNTQNPYFIWLSEIILQQTRVAQGLPYYEKYMEHFPTIENLAAATEDEVLRVWQGLGYYSRGRNLHFTAKYIVNELKGEFPNVYEELIKLKGVGQYTAAAIASFAYKEKVAAVDGNVIRVISRLFKITEAVDNPVTLKAIFKLSNDLIQEVEPDLYNQAMMEFGATLCTPKVPKCTECPVQSECLSFPGKDYVNIPWKSKKTKVIDREIDYLIIISGSKIFMRQRTADDIWKGLYDFPELTDLQTIINYNNKSILKPVTHILSHRKLRISFTVIETEETNVNIEGRWVGLNEAEKLPKPKVIADVLNFLHS